MLNKNYRNSKKKLRIVACIQARMGSTRLKKKALIKILGKTLIEHIFERLKGAEELDDIVLSTSINQENDILIKHARDIALKYYRGSEKDLISRLYQTAKKFKADAIVRITADCPLVDPNLIDKMVKIYRESYKRIDFMTNVFPPTFPDGLDIDISPYPILKKLNAEVKNPLFREWCTVYIMENPKKFRIYNFKNSANLSAMRWTVDYIEDLAFVRKVYDALNRKDKIFNMNDILAFLKRKPQVLKINEKRIDRTVIRGIRSGAYHQLKQSKNK